MGLRVRLRVRLSYGLLPSTRGAPHAVGEREGLRPIVAEAGVVGAADLKPACGGRQLAARVTHARAALSAAWSGLGLQG